MEAEVYLESNFEQLSLDGAKVERLPSFRYFFPTNLPAEVSCASVLFVPASLLHTPT